jgi:hypothetical protein
MTDSEQKISSQGGGLISGVAWIAAFSLMALAGYLAWTTYTAPRPVRAAADAAGAVEKAAPAPAPEIPPVALPAFQPNLRLEGSLIEGPFIARRTIIHTTIPERPRFEVKAYTVEKGDSIFEISNHFKIKPETVLWANYAILNDNPDTIGLGMSLAIPPVDGVYYEWQEGDTVEAVAARFEANVEDILNWPENQFDLVTPTKAPGTMIMVPGGHREFRQWVIPTIPRGRAGVSRSVYGEGACEGGYDGALGTGSFVWPAGNHSLSGNDYWPGHLAIDIAAGEGAPIFAADSGVVVYAGWANGGYGNMVMIDHGNGYQTLYAHMSSVSTRCGSSVGQGGTIGYAGSTGNSTGAHLHFELRYQGGFTNPWGVLP